MRCIAISKPGGPEVLVVAERPSPAPQAHEILVKDALFSFTGHVIPRTALLLFVLMLPREADWYSVDGWLSRRSGP